jgi:outer membrane protein assembly factor BamB
MITGLLNIFNYNATVADYGKAAPPVVATGEWTQHAYDAQRTAWNPVEVTPPWRFAWKRTDVKPALVPRNQILPITGNNRVYMATSSNNLFALNITNGSTIWSVAPGGNLLSTPAYDPQSDVVFVNGGTNLYRINAATGAVTHTYAGGANLETAPLLVGDYIYVTSSNGKLHKVNKSNLSGVWVYSPSPGGQNQVTMPSYSASKNLVIYATDPDLNVHAVNDANGSLKWKVKPTVETYRCGQMGEGPSCIEFKNNWPVVADNMGVVLLRMRHGYDAMYFSAYNPMPTTNSGIKQAMEAYPQYQTLFALDLETGQRKFTPAIKYGAYGDGTLYTGPQPAIKTLPDGKQVAYIIYSNGQTCASESWCDYREDATMGEMVLDNDTVPGYTAGDARFVKFIDVQTDEQGLISGSGNIVFHTHWIASLEGLRITDRSNSLGATFTNPIKGEWTPFVIDVQGGESGCSSCSNYYCSPTLCGEGGARRYPAGFAVGTSGWHLYPYVVTSGEYVIIKHIDGSLFVLRKGNPTGAVSPQVAGATTDGETVVTCEIKYLYRSSRFYYLGCGQPHEGNFQGLIPVADLGKFATDSYPLGVTVTMKGVKAWFQGDPVIYLTENWQLK